MSTIVGHFGLDGAATQRANRMLKAANKRASFNPQTVPLGDVGNGAFGYAGHAATRASLNEPRPFTHPATGIVITGDIRLDNRDELCSRLQCDAPSVGDAELALLAYLQWGTSFASHLLGDFVVALFDPRSGEIVLTRDHLGIRPVLYTYGRDWFVFGSTLRSVRDGADRDFEVYIDKLQHVLLNPLEVIEPETTFYKDIHRLGAASTLVWRSGASPVVSRYWRPERGHLKLGSDREYQDAFLEVFDAAIACRLEATTGVASMLSGGLDSSAVVARAQNMVDEPLRTYAFVESEPGAGSDAFAIRTCQSSFRGDHVSFDEADLVRSFNLDDLLADPDSPFDVDMNVLRHTSSEMAQSGYGVVLTGIGGDELVAISQRSFARSLSRSGRLGEALREMAHNDGQFVPRQVARFVAADLGPQRLVELARKFNSTPSRFEKSVTESGIDLYSDAGQRLVASFASLNTRPEWNTGDDQVDRVGRPMLTIGLERYDRVGARSGVEVRHPLCDKRIVELCLALPGEQLQRNGWTKYVLRAAVPALPHQVAWRPKEYVGWSPATMLVRETHAPQHRVPAIDGVFGPLPPGLPVGLEQAASWRRHTVQRWWTNHGPT